MKKNLQLLLLFFIVFLPAETVFAQGLKGFKLQNGLTVYIWEDFSKPDVFGMVGINAGATQDPENLTGLAHYLEHVMFKGTDKIGTSNWEKEKPIYEQIIAKYDEMAATQDPVQKEQIGKEINKLSLEAAQYMVTHEFAGLTEEMGGNDLNAGTGFDNTSYFNYFPPSEIYRWLDLNSERFINPVFRAFQAELETVYEEFNMIQDEQRRQERNFILSNLFPGHPYSRGIIGKAEHLKNPRLSELIKFYNEWYVPENMVLILVGNVKTSQVRGIIQDKFGRLQGKQSPERKEYPDWNIKGRKSVSAKIGTFPTTVLAFKGVPTGHPDKIALDICMSILSNSSNTGLLDKLQLEGDVMSASTWSESLKDQGRIMIQTIPSYDVNQRRFLSSREVEKLLWKEIKKLQEGDIEEWLIPSIQGDMIRNFDLAFESSSQKAYLILSAHCSNQEIGEMLAYKERVAAVSIDEIKQIAKKYLTDDFLVIDIQEGKGEKSKKLDKPAYDPIVPGRNNRSAYGDAFAKLPVMNKEPEFCDFNAIQTKKVNKLSKLFYNKNEENEVFSLTLRYGIGLAEMPKLDYAVSLMNSAGIMGLLEPQELKQAFSELGATCRFSVNDSYLTITMIGYEEKLQEACNLLTRQILMPKLEEKQLNNIIGREMQMRHIEKEYIDIQKQALSQYLRYQDKSEFIDRLPMEEVQAMTVSSLTGEFARATDYEAEIHYVGTRSFDDVYNILSANLPLKANEKASASPVVKEIASYKENTIYFVSENDVQQSSIYLLMNGKPYSVQNRVVTDAFNQYFDGEFNGLLMKEIREFRSMAYATGGQIQTPALQGKDTYLSGFIGTQNDKTIDAIEIFLSLINEMPEYPDRIHAIKGYLQKTALINKPSFRYASLQYEIWKKKGYTEDPAKSELPVIESLTFDDILSFYKTEIKDKPIAIAIIGDPKRIDIKQLEKFGKVVRINKSKLFSSK